MAITKPSFLEILQKTRLEVYTVECITGAWRKSNCWPINCNFNVSDNSKVSGEVSDNVSVAQDTPIRLRKLTRQGGDIIRNLPVDSDIKSSIFEVIDFAVEKVTKDRDNVPRAETLSKLHNGKVRRDHMGSNRVGEARILTSNHVDAGLKKLAQDIINKVKRQRAWEDKKKAVEERMSLRENHEKQWRVDLQLYNGVIIPSWQAECAEIDAVWASQLGRKEKKPPYPPRPKRPLKPKIKGVGPGGGADLSTVLEDTAEGSSEGAYQGDAVEEADNKDLVDSLREMGISHFAEVGSTTYCGPALLQLHTTTSILIPYVSYSHLVDVPAYPQVHCSACSPGRGQNRGRGGVNEGGILTGCVLILCYCGENVSIISL